MSFGNLPVVGVILVAYIKLFAQFLNMRDKDVKSQILDPLKSKGSTLTYDRIERVAEGATLKQFLAHLGIDVEDFFAIKDLGTALSVVLPLGPNAPVCDKCGQFPIVKRGTTYALEGWAGDDCPHETCEGLLAVYGPEVPSTRCWLLNILVPGTEMFVVYKGTKYPRDDRGIRLFLKEKMRGVVVDATFEGILTEQGCSLAEFLRFLCHSNVEGTGGFFRNPMAALLVLVGPVYRGILDNQVRAFANQATRFPVGGGSQQPVRTTTPGAGGVTGETPPAPVRATYILDVPVTGADLNKMKRNLNSMTPGDFRSIVLTLPCLAGHVTGYEVEFSPERERAVDFLLQQDIDFKELRRILKERDQRIIASRDR